MLNLVKVVLESTLMIFRSFSQNQNITNVQPNKNYAVTTSHTKFYQYSENIISFLIYCKEFKGVTVTAILR